jgi:ABC-type Fe3+ transport system permease subunit
VEINSEAFPQVPPPPRKTLRLRIHRLRSSDDLFRWLWRHVWWLVLLFAIVYVLGALAIDGWWPGKWKMALDLLLGDAPPSAILGPGYFAAAALAILGWLLAPALVGAIVSLIVARLTVRRVTQDEVDKAVQRALGRTNEPGRRR